MHIMIFKDGCSFPWCEDQHSKDAKSLLFLPNLDLALYQSLSISPLSSFLQQGNSADYEYAKVRTRRFSVRHLRSGLLNLPSHFFPLVLVEAFG